MSISNCNWAIYLTEVQKLKLERIISKVPGFFLYLTERTNVSDFIELTENYRLVLQNRGLLTVGADANLGVLAEIYKDYNNASVLRQHHVNNPTHNPQSVLNWTVKPKWTLLMDERDIDYIDHFLPQVPGLLDFLYRTPNRDNLNDLIDYFERQIMKHDCTKNVKFVLDTIKLTFSKTMDRHKEALLFINKSLQIRNDALLRLYQLEAKENLYYKSPTDEECKQFITKFAACNNPFISCDIAKYLVNSKLYNEAFHFIKLTFIHIFSSPNIYWNNAESIYGCANAMNLFVQILGSSGIERLEGVIENSKAKIIETFFLLLSRVLYWDEKETFVKESYGERDLPINIEHKLQFYRVRSQLIIDIMPLFGLVDQYKYKIGAMAMSDMISADKLAKKHNIVSDNSIYKRDATELFHKYNLFKLGDMDIVAEKGKGMIFDYSLELYRKYRRGNYCLSQEDIACIFYNVKHGWNLKSIRTSDIEPTPLTPVLEPTGISYKAEADKIRKYLLDNNIKCFYHFTDASKISSIKKNGGLLSSKRCLDEGISIPVRRDMAKSRDIDARKDLEDFVRLSFCKRLPKLYERQANDANADFVLLHIDVEVALLDSTMFTDKEATLDEFNCGDSFADLSKVDLHATQKEYCPDTTDPNYWQYQAEILVKGRVPLNYILNIDSPEVL